MTQVYLQRLWIASFPQAIDSIRVPEQVTINPFGDPGPFCCRLYNLEGTKPVDGEEPIIQSKFVLIGIASQAVSQAFRAGHQPVLLPLASYMENGQLLISPDMPGR